jgi:outer membrane protein OmpA-like peptidoglycan-associated protein
VEKYPITRQIWAIILVAVLIVMIPGCGSRPGATQEPESPAQPDVPGDHDASPQGGGIQAGPVDGDGHTEVDEDGDGVPDGQDQCPHLAEEINGVDDLDGCPDLAKIDGCQIVVTEKILFRSDPNIEHKSYDVLNVVAEIIKSNPDLGVISIEVHADSPGPAEYNMAQSEYRAQNVKSYLVDQGVPTDALIAVGRGDEEPLVEAKTKEEWYKNCRVEFHIVECEESPHFGYSTSPGSQSMSKQCSPQSSRHLSSSASHWSGLWFSSQSTDFVKQLSVQSQHARSVSSLMRFSGSSAASQASSPYFTTQSSRQLDSCSAQVFSSLS